MKTQLQIFLKAKLFTLFLVILFLAITVNKADAQNAKHATGGTGLYKNSIWWLDLSGISLASGSSTTRDFVIGNATVHVTITSTLSTVASYKSGTFSGDGMDDLYNIGGTGTSNTLTYALKNSGANAAFTVSAYVTYTSGVNSPLGLIFGNAESDGTTAPLESERSTTNGSTWQLLEKSIVDISTSDRNAKVTFSNNNLTAEVAAGGNPRANVILLSTTKASATAASPLVVNTTLIGTGTTAVAIGLIINQDYSDAPTTFGTPAHTFQPVLTGGDPSQTSGTFTNYMDAALGTPVMTVGTITNPTNLKLGVNAGDADPNTFPATAGADATGDDTNNIDDEDGVASFSALTTASTTYSVTVSASNSTGSDANLCGWIDFNKNNVFDTGEGTCATVPTGSSNASIVLTWTGLSGLTAGTTYARFRITNDALITSSSTATVVSGEVEDYQITIDCSAGTAQVPLTASTLTNTCPDATVNLNSLFTGTAPGASTLVWFTNNAHTGTAYTTPTIAPAGTYYAFFYDAAAGCYNTAASTAQVTVTINTTGMCDVAVNGTFTSNLIGWTNTSGGWVSENKGGSIRASNYNTPVSSQDLSQSLTGLNSGSNTGQVKLTFTLGMGNFASNPFVNDGSGASLKVSLGGTLFGTFTNPTDATGAVIYSAAGGATVTLSPDPYNFPQNLWTAQSGRTLSTTVTMVIPWVSQPDVATLNFGFTSVGGGDDIGIDDVSVVRCLSKPVPTALTMANVCPAVTVDLSTIQPAPVSGWTYEWHTVASNPSAATKVSSTVAVSNTYYLYGLTSNGCYTPASDGVVVTITSCGYIYLHHQATNEESSPDFTFNVTGGSVNQNYTLNDQTDFLSSEDLGASQSGRLWALARTLTDATFNNFKVYYRDINSSTWVAVTTPAGSPRAIDGSSGSTAIYSTNATGTSVGRVYAVSSAGVTTDITGNLPSGIVYDVSDNWLPLDSGGRQYAAVQGQNIYQRTTSALPAVWTVVSGTASHRVDAVPKTNNLYYVTGNSTTAGSTIFYRDVMAGSSINLTTASNSDDMAITEDGTVIAGYKKMTGTPAAPVWTDEVQGMYGFNVTGGPGSQFWASVGITNVNNGNTAVRPNRIMSRTSTSNWIDDERIRATGTHNDNSLLLSVAPGTYTITENTEPAGWRLQSITTDPAAITNLSAKTTTVTIAGSGVSHVVYANVNDVAAAMPTDCTTGFTENFGTTEANYASPTISSGYHNGAPTLNGTTASAMGYGYYGLIKNSNLITGDLASGNGVEYTTGFTDHTSGTGRMLGVNSTGQPRIFYQKRITGLTIGIAYNYSVWVRSADINAGNLPNIGLQILNPTTGAILFSGSSGTIANANPPAAWRQVTLNFTAAQTTVDIALSSLTAGAWGNDFAVDDVTLTPVKPTAPVIGTITPATCTSTGSVALSGLPGSGTWTLTDTNGGATMTGTGTSATFANLAAGTHNFTVTLDTCVSLASANAVVGANCTDLTIHKMGTAGVSSGATTTYSLLVSNNGPVDATNVVVKDAAVANFTATGITATAGPGSGSSATVPTTLTIAALQGATGLIIPSLPAGSTITFVITGTAGTSGTIANTATVAPPATIGDSDTSNNTSTYTTTIGTCTGATTTYTFDSAATLAAAGTAGVNGGTINLIYNLSSGTAIPAFGNSISIPMTYSDFKQDFTGVDHKWDKFIAGGLAGSFALVPDEDTWYTSLPSKNTVSKALPSAGATDNFFSTRIADAASTGLLQLGTFDITYGAAPTTSGIRLMSESITNLGVCNTAGSTTMDGGWWLRPMDQPNTNLTATGSDVAIQFVLGNKYTYRYSAFSNGSSKPTEAGNRGVWIYSGAITYCTECAAGTAQVVLSSTALSACSPNTVNLNTAFTGTAPAGSSLVWFTTANRSTTVLTPAQSAAAGAGTYYAFFYDSVIGCYNTTTSTSSVVVTINPTPAITTTSTNPTTCGSTNGTIVISGLTAGASYTSAYTLNGTTTNVAAQTATAGGTITISGLSAGSYTNIIATSVIGSCPSNATTATLSNPAAPAAPTIGTITQPTCAVSTGSVALSGLPAGAWTITTLPATVSTAGSGATTTISSLPAGTTYKFIVTNNTTACSSAASADAVINVAPATVATPGAISGPTCVLSPASGQVYSVTAVPGATTYTWTYSGNFGITGTGIVSGSGTNSITVNFGENATSGTLSVTVTTACGTGSASTLNIVVQPTPSIISLGESTICPSGGSVILSSTPAPAYQWYKDNVLISGATSQNYTATATGAYTVITSSGSCVSPASAPFNVIVQDTTPPVFVSPLGTQQTAVKIDFDSFVASGIFNALPRTYGTGAAKVTFTQSTPGGSAGGVTPTGYPTAVAIPPYTTANPEGPAAYGEGILLSIANSGDAIRNLSLTFPQNVTNLKFSILDVDGGSVLYPRAYNNGTLQPIKIIPLKTVTNPNTSADVSPSTTPTLTGAPSGWTVSSTRGTRTAGANVEIDGPVNSVTFATITRTNADTDIHFSDIFYNYTAPILPADATVDCAAIPAPVVLTATDNCSSANVVYTQVPAVYTPSTVTQTITRTWVATDSAGNTTTHTQTITVNPTSPAPVMAANQSFCATPYYSLANVAITGTNVKWYADAITSTQLPVTTLLVNGATYYATQTSVGVCESTRVPVTVELKNCARINPSLRIRSGK